MTALRLLASAAALTIVAGCATTSSGPSGPPAKTPASSPAQFRTSDFAWSAQPGRASVTGGLAYRRGAQTYSCAGAAVVLTPETGWTRQRMVTLYKSSTYAALPVADVRARTPSEPGEDYSAFVRRTTCDAQNRFAFTSLPDGGWFVITVAKPAVGTGENVAVMRYVTTKGGRATTLGL